MDAVRTSAAPVAGEADHRLSNVETVVVCIGAQKASTTWLHQLLESRPDAARSRFKEIEYWWEDAIFHGRVTPMTRVKQVSELTVVRDYVSAMLSGGPKGMYRFWKSDSYRRYREKMRTAPSLDDYLSVLLPDPSRQYGVAMDFSPNYALLTQESFRDMYRFFGDKLRVVLIMREPVERIWSMAKHYARNSAANLEEGRVQDEFRKIVEKPSDIGYSRSRYELTAQQLEEAIPPKQILYLFHESIRSPEEMERLRVFLGFDTLEAETLSKAVNVSETKQVPPPALVEMARRQLEPTYEWAQRRFGGRLPDKWRVSAPTRT